MTAMQQLINFIENDIMNNPQYKESPRLREGAMMVRVKATELLEPEKQNIMNDFNSGLVQGGFGDGQDESVKVAELLTAEDYYNQKFKP